MHESFDYFEKRPAPSLTELREGVELLLSCYGGNFLRPAIKNNIQQPELVVSAPFEDGEGTEGTTFISKLLTDGSIQVENYITYHNPDGTRDYIPEPITEIGFGDEGHEEHEEATPEVLEFYDELRRKTAREILGVWEYYERSSAKSLALT